MKGTFIFDAEKGFKFTAGQWELRNTGSSWAVGKVSGALFEYQKTFILLEDGMTELARQSGLWK